MYEVELKYVKRRINRLHRNKKLDNKKIYLFGVSDNTRQIIQVLRDLGHEPLRVIDNDQMKQNSYCSRVKVVPLKAIEQNGSRLVLIYSSFWREMRLQIIKSGFRKSEICILGTKGHTLWYRFYESYLGRRAYRRLTKKYGNVPMFLCPYTGTGDIYLIGTFWNEYVSKNGIEDYTFLVISGACKKVASLFDIKNVELLKNQKESEFLIRYRSLCPAEIHLKLLNDGWAQVVSNPSEWFRGYKGMDFMRLFRKFVFDLPDTSMPQHPEFLNASKELDILFEKNELVEKKTVILSPYSNTLADLPDSFWRELVKALSAKGYKVCTNSSGKQEPAITGSIPVFFPLDIAPQFVEKAGFFIGVRSGFCDVISGADAQKVILYDAKNRFYNTSAYEYFNLRNMGLCWDAIEIQYRYDKLDSVISQILRTL